MFLLVGSIVPARLAYANDCVTVTEQAYWIRSSDSSAFGTQNTIPVKDRALALDCMVEAENHHTANIRDTASTTQAEAGYVEMYASAGSGHVCRFFWEVGVGSATVGDFSDGPQVSCTLGSTGFRVVNVDGTNKWKFYYNTGSGYTQFGPSGGQDAGFHRGYPRGESGRRGDPGTSAADDQSGLKWKAVRSCTGNCWTSSWSTNALDNGCIHDWVYSRVSATEFKIVSGTHSC